MLVPMKPMFDAFWRAVAYCLHPRVMALSLLPLVLLVLLSLGLGYFFWHSAVAGMEAWITGMAVVESLTEALHWLGVGGLRSMLAPVMVLALATPVLVVLCLLLVAWLMTPALVELVTRRRFPDLLRRNETGWWTGLFWTLGATVVAAVVMVLSMPLWLIPPLVLVLPPLIWGWLTYRVFTFDALAAHASAAERKQLISDNRVPLLVMGVLSGYLGAAPSLIWASGAMWIALAPLLIPVAIWLYTLVLAFSSLWFVHYTLAALELQRKAAVPAPPATVPVEPPVALVASPVVLDEKDKT
jgi:hypothetical protein